MAEFVVNNTLVNIDLEPGIYDFTNESGLERVGFVKPLKLPSHMTIYLLL